MEEMEHIYWQDDIYLARLVEESYVRGEKRGTDKNNLSVFLFCFVFFFAFFEPVDGGLSLSGRS